MMKMKIPPPVTMKNLATDEVMPIDGSIEPWDMHKYIITWVLSDPSFGNGYQANYDRVQIAKKFKALNGATEIELDDNWVKCMQNAVNTPKGQIPGWAGMQCLCFQEAIRNAK